MNKVGEELNKAIRLMNEYYKENNNYEHNRLENNKR